MKSNSFFRFFLFLVCLIIASCVKEQNDNLIAEELFIDEALAPYFERFKEEGAKRGLDIDLVERRIEGYIANLDGDNVVGQCSYSATSPRRVTIDQSYWNQVTDLQRELVIFHELGHCYLERSHLDDQTNRACISIMNSGTSGCRLRYTTLTRTEYLDELFE